MLPPMAPENSSSAPAHTGHSAGSTPAHTGHSAGSTPAHTGHSAGSTPDTSGHSAGSTPGPATLQQLLASGVHPSTVSRRFTRVLPTVHMRGEPSTMDRCHATERDRARWLADAALFGVRCARRAGRRGCRNRIGDQAASAFAAMNARNAPLPEPRTTSIARGPGSGAPVAEIRYGRRFGRRCVRSPER
ncbi:hypothetical protein CH251_15985 [Rhodococcus sp. 06-462-5]|nr:hypothetical protein CH251_15985 [Rhodococcus sp. 06-462-5]OZE70471.1 hypothetical protein CH270_00505 [Rhodococcus sp. 02-925g]